MRIFRDMFQHDMYYNLKEVVSGTLIPESHNNYLIHKNI